MAALPLACLPALVAHTHALLPRSTRDAEAIEFDPAYHNFPMGGACQWKSPKRIAFVHVGKTAGMTLRATNDQDLPKHLLVNWTVIHEGSFDSTQDSLKGTSGLAADFDIYILPTRDPLSRVISAFNWHHVDGGGVWNVVPADNATYDSATVAAILAEPLSSPPGSSHAYDFWAALSACFPQLPGGVNAFAEALESPSRCGQLARRSLLEPTCGGQHLSQGFAYYYNFLLDDGGNTTVDRMRAQGEHVFHVSQENFDLDAQALWKYLCVADAPTADEMTSLEPFPLSNYTNRSLLRHDDTSLSAAGTAALKRHLTPEYTILEEIRALTENKLSDPLGGAAMRHAAHVTT